MPNNIRPESARLLPGLFKERADVNRRLADYLFRFTDDKSYADYIEKNLYNGFLAQQNKHTGMPAYFLPLKAGSKKQWGSRTRDFWCCHGTTVQAHTLYPMLCYYEENDRVIIAQYINSRYNRSENVTITQNIDMKYYNGGASFDENDSSRMSRWYLRINVSARSPEEFTLSLRIPDWVSGEPVILVNCEPVKCASEDSFCDIKRQWTNDVVSVYFPAALTTSALPDMPKLTAFLEGPIVLAGLCGSDRGIEPQDGSPESALVNVADEKYTVYFTVKER